MKKSRILLLLGLLPLLTAASVNGYPCPPRHVNVITKDGSETKPSKLEVKPDTIRVMSGCSFELKFPSGKTVSTKSSKGWLTKGESSVSPIIIKVDDDVEDGTYKYEVIVKGFGTLDPRARVKN